VNLLLASVDADGACNRAYYIMFDAARAALMEFQKSDEVLTIPNFPWSFCDQ